MTWLDWLSPLSHIPLGLTGVAPGYVPWLCARIVAAVVGLVAGAVLVAAPGWNRQ